MAACFLKQAGVGAALFGAAIGENTPRYGAVLRMDRQDPAVSETGGHDQRLVIMELGEAGLGIGVDKGLPIDPPNPFQRGHLEGVSRAAKAKTFGFELASHHFPQELVGNANPAQGGKKAGSTCY